MSRDRAARVSRGFTLVEVMVALIVFAVGMLSLALLMPAGTRGVRKAGQNTRGSELAASSMERLLSTPYDDPDLNRGNHVDTGNPHDNSYFVSWSVDTGVPIANCKRITLSVAWPTAASSNTVRLVGVKPLSDQ